MTGRVMRAFCAATFVAAVAAPAAQAGHAPKIAGETVVVAQRTSTMRVHVPTRAKVLIDHTKSFDAEGPGRLVGLILREHHRGGTPDELGFLRMPTQWGKDRSYQWGPGAYVTGCTDTPASPLPPVHTDCTNGKMPTHYDLHKGTYTLIAITDGAPVRFTLRFDNLSGSTTLRPSTVVPSGATNFATGVESQVSWSGGAVVAPPATAEVFAIGWWKQDESPAAAVGFCSYEGGGVEALGAYRWAPGCPTGSSGSISEVRNPVYGGWLTNAGSRAAMLTTNAPAGANGFGIWNTAQNVRDAGGVVFWVAA